MRISEAPSPVRIVRRDDLLLQHTFFKMKDRTVRSPIFANESDALAFLRLHGDEDIDYVITPATAF